MSGMADVPAPGYQSFWTNTRSALKSEYHSLIGKFPDVEEQLKSCSTYWVTMRVFAAFTSSSVGDSEQWSAVVYWADENRQNLYKTLSGMNLSSALYGTYIVALHELKAVLKANTLASQSKTRKSAATQEDGFKKVRRRKRHKTDESAPTSKRAVPTAASDAVDSPPNVVVTCKFFAPLRAATMDTDSSSAEATPQEEAVPGKKGRPTPIVITAATNLMQLQKVIKSVVKENFEFRNIRNGSRVITKILADFAAAKSHLKTYNLPYFTFYPKYLKPFKAVIRHIPMNTPAEDISEGLMELGFVIISVKQMTTNHRSQSEKTPTTNLPLFLFTLPRTAKSQVIV
jgi:hypothetical protein